MFGRYVVSFDVQSEEMVDDVERADAALSELEVVDKLASAVEVSHRLAELTQQHVRETATSPLLRAAVRRRPVQLVKRDSLESERRRDVLDDVVGAAPVAPRLVETVQIAGRHERAHYVRCVRVRRSLRQQRHLSTDERVQLLVAAYRSRNVK